MVVLCSPRLALKVACARDLGISAQVTMAVLWAKNSFHMDSQRDRRGERSGSGAPIRA
jgi:hypothetical protein